MFDIGFWEIAVIGAIMLVVLGPERLPGVARTAGFWLSKIRKMVTDVKSEVKREMDAAELKELDDAKNQIQEATKSVHEQMNKDVLADANITGTPIKNKTESVDESDNKSDKKTDAGSAVSAPSTPASEELPTEQSVKKSID